MIPQIKIDFQQSGMGFHKGFFYDAHICLEDSMMPTFVWKILFSESWGKGSKLYLH